MASRTTQSQQTTNFFEGGSNINLNESNIVAGNHNTVVTNNVNSSSSWLELLASHCAHDALVDSKERYDPPHCAPNTREAIQREIVDWINTLTLVGLVMWLNGSAGAGKSAITQTIAERIKNEATPSASFFFSRISGSPTRVNGDCLLPTIIYQLCQLIPEYRRSVMKKLKTDPSIFELSRSSQMAILFTKPLQRFSFTQMLRNLRRRPIPIVIIIDGLDECRDSEVQCDLLRILADAAASVRRRPLRILIASRPEAHITRTFDQHPRFREGGLRRINLDEDQDASMDILTLLRQGFHKIHREHPLRKYLDPSWPTQDHLDFLVSKSSPQMMLASTAMSYIASPKHRPTDRLITVITLLSKPTSSLSDRPLQRLDSLYAFIFGSTEVENREILQAILGILHLSSLKEFHLPPPTPAFIEKALGLQPGDAYLYLEPIISVIHLPEHPERPIRSLHASLFDFLLNPARSNELALNLDYGYAGLVGHFFLQSE
ncbi:hypothetical protein CPB83DRAFT_920844 [Crepidotus variabilis]|uniref:Nephrocystin 3-like N-terminal domain-containing protein n=1 Tax=Crepidotus variabilis TaxID=179855 RepID=A0A9P6EJC4_9AGAR|nr:hypothetical protein CPB83DRAFT_920844 [Crepidotus variabilis]